jgi:protein MpaA
MLLKASLYIFFATFYIAASAQSARTCSDFSFKIPNVPLTLCEAGKLKDMQGRSVQGRVLWGRDVQAEDAKLRVLVLGGIHGDEMSSVSMVFHWINFSLSPPADMPAPIHWRFIPSLNPDGLFSQPSRRVNARGVDLNRNFPTPNWERDAKMYWENRTKRDPRRWPGNKPLSEPETRFLIEQMDSFKPNLIVSIHAPYGVLDFDGPSVPPSKLGRLYLDQVGIFPGSLGNYGGIHRGVPVVTVELSSAWRTPHTAEMRQMWMDLQRWTVERLGDNKVATQTPPARSP